MRIPSKGRYAINAMLDLAINRHNKPLTIADISEKHCISLSYLEQLFADLRKNGLVLGTRGPGGGYKLAKPLEDINIADIILAVEKNAVDKNDASEQYTPYTLWSDLSDHLNEFLTDISLADCVQNAKTKAALAQQQNPQSTNSKQTDKDQVAA